MDKRQFEHFVRVFETGSMSAAARKEGMTQPAMTQSIRKLENSVGHELFHRGASGVTLTEAGRRLVPAALDVLRSYESARTAVERTDGQLTGTLRIVCPATLVYDPLVSALRRFREEHSQVRLGIIAPRIPAEAIEAVERGTADCALFSGEVFAEHLDVVAIAEQEIVAVVPPGAEVVDPSLPALLARGLICAPRGQTIRSVLDEAAGPMSVARSVVLETDHAGMIIPLVLSGVGIAFLPRAVAQRSAEQIDIGIVEPEPRLLRTVVLATRRDSLAPPMRAFRAVVERAS